MVESWINNVSSVLNTLIPVYKVDIVYLSTAGVIRQLVYIILWSADICGVLCPAVSHQ